MIFDIGSHCRRIVDGHTNPPHARLDFEMYTSGCIFCCTARLQGNDVFHLAYGQRKVMMQRSQHLLFKCWRKLQDRQPDARLAELHALRDGRHTQPIHTGPFPQPGDLNRTMAIRVGFDRDQNFPLVTNCPADAFYVEADVIKMNANMGLVQHRRHQEIITRE